MELKLNACFMNIQIVEFLTLKKYSDIMWKQKSKKLQQNLCAINMLAIGYKISVLLKR